jgi:hypothetical protein
MEALFPLTNGAVSSNVSIPTYASVGGVAITANWS